MSANNEFVILLREALCIHADMTVFPTIWAVLSILLDTQDSTAEYYNVKLDKQMQQLEARCFLIQDCLYDNVQNDFDRVSDQEDNGPIPLQGQQDEQS